MKINRGNTMITTLSLVSAAIIVLILFFSWGFARMWCKPSKKKISKTPGHYNLSYEDISFTSNNKKINGWFVPGKRTGKDMKKDMIKNPLIILVHGWSSNASDMLPLANHYYDAGFSLLLYNARGHGSSENDGPVTIKKFIEDLTAGIDYIEQRNDVDISRLGVVGHSVGGSAVINAVSFDKRIKAAVSCSAFADPHRLIKQVMKKIYIPSWPFANISSFFISRWLGKKMDYYAPAKNITNVTVPLLLTHGDKDNFIHISNMYSILEKADSNLIHSQVINGSGHNSILKAFTREHKVITFMRDCFPDSERESKKEEYILSA
ncbi:MAG: alpha/beta fold hydrolase [bacterium]|nr:alpha/beta fold hydrolase [bacterium]